MVTKQSILSGRTVGVVALVAFMGCIVAAVRSEGLRDERERAIARGVSTLPPGTETAWLAYVDREFESAIIRDGDKVKIGALGDHILGKATFVSRNLPYHVGCDPVLGGTVYFGAGEDAIMVPIYGVSRIEPHDQPAPALSVDTESIAALHLADELCKRIAQHMVIVMATGSVQAAR